MRSAPNSVFAIVLLAATCGACVGDRPATAPAAGDIPSAHRPFPSVMADFQSVMVQYRAVVPSTALLADPAQRAAVASRAIPILKRLGALAKEFATAGDEGPMLAAVNGSQIEQLLLVLGDPDTLAQNNAGAADPDPAVSIAAKRNLLVASWLQKPDVADQTRLLDSAQAMANASPTDLLLCQTLLTMSQLGSATPDLRERAKSIATKMQTPQSAQLQAEAVAEEKLRALENKPLVITGKRVEGKPFTTADWKGKVILVDFWATWCEPCRAALPLVKKAYADFHSRGLDVLGVSNDYDAKTLNDFVAADAGMPWPQLLDPEAAAAQQWNPISMNLGVDAIPRMFLIDKQGILRSADAEGDLDQLLPKLLSE